VTIRLVDGALAFDYAEAPRPAARVEG